MEALDATTMSSSSPPAPATTMKYSTTILTITKIIPAGGSTIESSIIETTHSLTSGSSTSIPTLATSPNTTFPTINPETGIITTTKTETITATVPITSIPSTVLTTSRAPSIVSTENIDPVTGTTTIIITVSTTFPLTLMSTTSPVPSIATTGSNTGSSNSEAIDITLTSSPSLVPPLGSLPPVIKAPASPSITTMDDEDYSPINRGDRSPSPYLSSARARRAHRRRKCRYRFKSFDSSDE